MDIGSLWGVQAQSYGLASVLTSQLMRVSTGVGVQWGRRSDRSASTMRPVQYEPWDKQQAIRFSFGTRF